MIDMLFPVFLRFEVWPHIATVLLGLAALGHGRRHTWLFGGLGGYLLGQVIGATLLPNWGLYAVLALSVGIGAAAGALTLAAERPLLTVASFAGVGYLAFVLCGLFGVGNPWNLVAYTVAGALGAAALLLSHEQALAVNLSLTSAAAIVANLGPWLLFLRGWNGWTEMVIATVVIVVGVIHNSRALPAPVATPVTNVAPGRAG
jgi:hypothetical protein